MSGREILVRVSDLQVGGPDDTLVTLGLGSCVAILLHDREARIGGMAHVLLPSAALSRTTGNPAKFPSTAVPLLVQQMVARGARRDSLTARLVGGASMFATLMPPGAVQMGERNVVASREVLVKESIPIIAEEVGGEVGRSVRFVPADGAVTIRTVAQGERAL